MKLFKNYKKLYKIELNNRKLIEERKKEVDEWNVELQKNMIHSDKMIRSLKIENTELKMALEDTKGFLAQEKECSNALRKERTKLRRKITNLEKNLLEAEPVNVRYFSNKSGETKEVTCEQAINELEEYWAEEDAKKAKKVKKNGKERN